MNLKEGKDKAKKFYDQEAQEYINQYKKNYNEYPANLLRLNFTIPLLKKNNIKTVLDTGCGTCGPLIRLLQEGFKVKGFDFSEKMIDEGKKELIKSGYDPDIIFKGDLEDEKIISDEKFDAVIAYGIFPHIIDENKALRNISKVLKKNGKVFIEFRNDLFATFSLNRYSIDFFLNRLIDTTKLSEDVLKNLVEFYSKKLNVEKPKINSQGKISYTDILAKFKNPLTIERDLFMPNNFTVNNIHFYHFHALPPIFEKQYPELFFNLSMNMEKTDDPKGYLMASAYVIEATKND